MTYMFLALAVASAASAPASVAPTVAPAVLVVAPAPAASQPVIATPAVGSDTVLPTNTELLVSLNSELNSKKVRQGDMFDVTVVSDVMLGNYIVIPKGTPGQGQISYRTGKGAFGKSAKMEIELRQISFSGRNVPITGKYRQEGQGNTGATVGAAVAVGVFSVFVTGRSAIFTQGRELRAFTREAVPVVLPAGAMMPAVATVPPATLATVPAPTTK